MTNTNETKTAPDFVRCRRMKLWHRLNPVIRIAVTFAIGFFNVFHLTYASVKHGTILIYGSAFLYLIVLVMSLLTLKNRKPLTWAMIALFLVGILTKLINPFLGALPLALYVYQLIEIDQIAWLQSQPGYPNFHERLFEQEKISEKCNEEPVWKAPENVPEAMEEITVGYDNIEPAQCDQHWDMPDVEQAFIPKQAN